MPRIPTRALGALPSPIPNFNFLFLHGEFLICVDGNYRSAFEIPSCMSKPFKLPVTIEARRECGQRQREEFCS